MVDCHAVVMRSAHSRVDNAPGLMMLAMGTLRSYGVTMNINSVKMNM